jgi:uncharacterized protein YqcC (DUF446 family)
MPDHVNLIILKTHELEEELKLNGLWQNELPEWVTAFDKNSIISITDFAQWLQYIFIPNHLHKIKNIALAEKKLIGPQAMKYFGDDVKKGRLLQILVEIDALL